MPNIISDIDKALLNGMSPLNGWKNYNKIGEICKSEFLLQRTIWEHPTLS